MMIRGATTTLFLFAGLCIAVIEVQIKLGEYDLKETGFATILIITA